jgi:AcrR family transcriptional regulator
MDGIARSAKVSKETLYSRYRDKDSLFRAFVQDRLAAASAEAGKESSMLGDTLEQRLKYYARIAMTRALTAENRAFDRLLSGRSGTPRKIVRTLYEMRYRLFVDLVAREIREFTAADAHPAKYPERVAEVLLSAWSGWIRLETPQREVPEREAIAFAHRTIDYLLAGRAGW